MKTKLFHTALILALFALGLVLPAAAGQPGGEDDVQQPARGEPLYKPDEVLVRFQPRVSAPAVQQAHAAVGAQVLRTYSARLPGLQLVRIPAGMTVREAVRAYRAHPDVLYAEPNYIVRTQITPNDTRFPDLWGLHNTGQEGGTPDADIDAPEAWDITTGSSNVVVVVIDSGVDYNHPDLAANMAQLESNCSDGLDNDGNGFIDDCRGIDTFNGDTDPLDDFNHGTHVSGTIGAVGNNGMGVAGVNWTVRLLACKFIGPDNTGTISGAIACLDYVAGLKDMGVNIVATNNSWGFGVFSQALFDAVEAQMQRGILFVAAAMNAARDIDVRPFFPAAYYLPNIIAVAASNRFEELASFSNFGRRRVHLAAPGQAIVSTTRGNTYSSFSGTSMATPHVTGVAALLKAQDPNRDWKTIKNLILAGGDTVANFSPTVTGKRLNAHGALTCADSTVLSRLQPVADTVPGKVGEPIDLAVLHINCALPNGNVQVTGPGGSTITLFDDGNGPDQAAGDGIYTGEFIASEGGFFALEFPDGSSVTVMVPTAEPYVLLDLESQPNGFFSEPFGATFNWNTTTNRGNDPGHSPVTSFYFGDPVRFTYNCGDDPIVGCHEGGLLWVRAITLGPGPHLLAFNYYLETEGVTGVDLARVLATADPDDPFSFVVLADNWSGGLVDNTGQWQQAVADLSAFANQTVYIVFVFNTVDAFNNDFEGWYVDDLIVDSLNVALTAHGATVTEGDSGTTPLDFQLQLSRAGQDPLTVGFATADGTATAPDDYEAASGEVTFLPGETMKTVTVQVKGDTVKEHNESFILQLSPPDNVFLPFGIPSGVILNDEPNLPPVADAGPDQTVPALSASGASVQLDGSGSSDPDDDFASLSFNWFDEFGFLTGGPNPEVTLPIGENVITLAVLDSFGASDTDEVTITVTDFSLLADPPSQTVKAGESAAFTITGMPQFGPFNSSVTLSCPGPLPRGVSCSFSPSNMLTPGESGASLTLTVDTTATRTAALELPPEHRPAAPLYALWLGLSGVGALGLILLPGESGKRRRAVLLLALALGVSATLAGCGGGGSDAPRITTIPGTPTGTHSITVSASSGSLQHSVNVTLVVQ